VLPVRCVLRPEIQGVALPQLIVGGFGGGNDLVGPHGHLFEQQLAV
jgi:hypothetical protein